MSTSKELNLTVMHATPDTGTNFRIFHGGKFVTNEKTKKTTYVGGAVYLKMNMDEVCYFNFVDIVKNELNYSEVGKMWFRRHGLSLFAGRKQLVDDKGCEELVKSKEGPFGMVSLYVVKYEGLVMPSVKKQLDEAAKESRHCFIHVAGTNEFEVELRDNTFVGNLNAMTCSCFQWDLTGVPCTHVVACLLRKREKLDEYVHPTYTKEMYMKAYSPIVHPLPGMKQWEKTDYPQPGPPPFRKMPRRPSLKKRKKEAGEDQEKKYVKRKKMPSKCSNCGNSGHYKNRCKNPQSEASKKKEEKQAIHNF